MNVGSYLLWGFVATLLLASTMSMAQGVGWTRISLPFLLGTGVTGNRTQAMVWGTFAHLFMGMITALVHVAVYESLGWSSWWAGALAGAVQGLFGLSVLLQLLPYVHPRMASQHQGPTPERRLEPPGFMGTNYGKATPVVTLLAHLTYGIVLGSLYVPHS